MKGVPQGLKATQFGRWMSGLNHDIPNSEFFRRL